MSRRRKRSEPSPSHNNSKASSKKQKNVLSETNISDGSFISENSDAESEDTTMAAKYSKADLKEIATDLFSELKDQLVSDLKVEFRAIVDLETTKLKLEITSLRQENSELKDSLKLFASELDELEQYGRRMCLDISNIPGDTGSHTENVEKKILDQAVKFGVPLSPEDIDKCHRKGRFKTDASYNRKVIVRFTNSKARQRIYDARKTLGDGIFVHENLTRKREHLAFEARQLVRANSLKKTWVGGCKVYGLTMDKGKEVKFVIRDMDDIARIRQGHPPAPPAGPAPSLTPPFPERMEVGKYKLVYFNIRGRAQPIRYLFEDNGISYEDAAPEAGTWVTKVKPTTPFGQLPLLTLEDGFEMAQSNAMLRYLGNKHDLYCDNIKDKAKVDMINDHVEDMRLAYAKLIYTNYDDGKESYCKETLVKLGYIENLLKSWADELIVSKVTFADYNLFDLLDIHVILDPDCLKGFPTLQKYYSTMAARPGVKACRESALFKGRDVNGNGKQ